MNYGTAARRAATRGPCRKGASKLLCAGAAVQKLKERGFESPYLRAFVVARCNPLRFVKPGAAHDFDVTMGKMLDAARRFDPGKVKAEQLAQAGGPPEAAE